MSIKVFAIVRREDYGHLRQLLPELPSKFGTWIEQRFAARLEFENASSLKAKMQIIDPAAFAHFCSTSGNPPSVQGLDDWATLTAWLFLPDRSQNEK